MDQLVMLKKLHITGDYIPKRYSHHRMVAIGEDMYIIGGASVDTGINVQAIYTELIQTGSNLTEIITLDAGESSRKREAILW